MINVRPLMKSCSPYYYFPILLLILFTGCTSKVEKQAIKESDASIVSKDYSTALSTIQQALEKKPESQVLKRQRVRVFLAANKVLVAYDAYKALLLKPKNKKDKENPLAIPEYRENDPVLVDALKDKDPAVRACAAKVLATAKDEKSAKALVPLLTDTDGTVRQASANALGEILARKRDADGVAGPVNSKASAVVPGLVKALNDPDWFVRAEVVDALGSIGDESVAPDVFKLLEDKDSYVRDHAANAAVTLATEKNKAFYISKIADTNKNVRMTAALGLLNTRATEAEPVFLEVLKSENPGDRTVAIMALARIGSETGYQKVKELISTETELQPRVTAVLAIGEFGRKDSADYLVSIVKAESNPPEVRQAALAAYQKVMKKNPEMRDSPE